MDITIKQIQDSDSAYKIATALPAFFDEKGLNAIKKDTKEQILYGAYVDNKMVGFVTYKAINPEAIEITWTAVHPTYQNKGIGSKLIRNSLEEIAKQGYKVCEVKTVSEIDDDPGYANTRKFYKSLGFIPLETIHPYPGWGEKNPCQIFVKFI